MTEFLSTSFPLLDTCFNGGFLYKQITELTGASSTGKTQFALSMTASTLLQNKHDGPFPIERLIEILKHKTGEEVQLDSYLNNLYLLHIYSLDILQHFFQYQLLPLLEQYQDKGGVQLLILDTINGCFNEQKEKYKENIQILKHIGLSLKTAAESFNICVLILNQIISRIDSVEEGEEESSFSIGSIKILNLEKYERDQKPALGLYWSYWIHQRIQFYRMSDLRWFKVQFSPYVGNIKIYFDIQSKGIEIHHDE